MILLVVTAIASLRCNSVVTTERAGSGGTAPTSASTGAEMSASSSSGAAPTCIASDGVVFAMDHIDFGEDYNKWTAFGFNLDNLFTLPQRSSTKLVCLPDPNSWEYVPSIDGPEGLDNSFGKNILSLYEPFGPITQPTNDSIAKGNFTMLLDFGKLKTDPVQTSLVTRLYGGAALGSPPKLDGSDCWPVTPESLAGPSDVEAASVIFNESSIKGNTWTSGAPATVNLTVSFLQGSKLVLKIHETKMTLELASDRKSATKGILGGVLDTQELIHEIKKALGALDDGCNLLPDLDMTVRESSDILNDGSQDHTKTCNGISIGFGFTMKAVQLGGIEPAVPSNEKICP